MKIYLAGPMRGRYQFNFPAFHAYAKFLRSLGHTVFNPAERDESVYGKEFSKTNATGDEAKAAQAGFSLREALGADLDWICREAEAIALLPGFTRSAGARAELATARALKLKVMKLPTVLPVKMVNLMKVLAA